MKTKEEKKKSNLWFMLLVLLLISVILCISSFGIATWARYRSVAGSNVEAQIAKWSFKVNGEEEQFANINLADTIDFTHVTTDKIAPGTYGSFDLDIDGRGSEVSLDYYIDMIVAQKPTNMKFYLDSNYSQPIELAVGNKMFLEGDLLLSENPMQEIRTIYWKWDYRTATMPSQAVLNAYSSVIPGLETLVNDYNNASGAAQEEIAMKINDKIDTQEAESQVIVNVKVRGVQINPNFSLKRAQITSGKSQTYNVGDQVNLALEFTENVYGDNDGQSPVTNSNAPEVTLAFGGASASNPVAKVASLMSTNLKLSAGENVATFASVNGNKINYTYTIKSTDIGALRIASITGSVYNSAGKQINFGTVQAPVVPDIVGGTISAQIVEVSNQTASNITMAQLGDYVELGTNILDKTIALEDGSYPTTDWRVFKKEENGVWLILADYMPYSKLPSQVNLKKGISPYCLNSISDNDNNLLEELKNENHWKNLISNNSTLMNNPNVIVKGAITLQEWCESWNSNAGYTYINISGDEINGYYVNNNYRVSLSNDIGYSNSLYFTHKTVISQCASYWIASLSAWDDNAVMFLSRRGNLAGNATDISDIGIRPAVFIPNTVSVNTLNSVWTVSNSTASTSVEATPQINVAGQTVTLTKENAANYYGKVVTNYTQANATYRLFYVDFDGDFGPEGTVYLKADQVSETSLNTTASASSTTALEKMKQMNPQWRDNDGTANNNNELGALWLCDETKWTNYKDDSKADYAMGAPSIEMYVKSYNAYHSKKGTSGYQKLNCKWFSSSVSGYKYALGDSVTDGSYVEYTNSNTLKADENNMYVKSGEYWWLASPSAYYSYSVCLVGGDYFDLYSNYYSNSNGVCPLVSLKSDFHPQIAN